jgi:hypothetical protein
MLDSEEGVPKLCGSMTAYAPLPVMYETIWDRGQSSSLPAEIFWHTSLSP